VTVSWTVIPNLLYSPDLAPSDFHHVGPVGCTLRTLLCSDDKLKHSVCEELGCFSKEFVQVMYRQLWWSRGSVLPLSTQVHGFKPGRSRQDFSGRKNPQHAFLQRGSKAIGPMSQICGT
jgi:hypothetical protein